jgi:taurine dioxygenase
MEQIELDAIKEIATIRPPHYRTLVVSPLTPIIGAEVSGVDLSKELSAEESEDIKRAFLHHHVLVFRDQVISTHEHKRFARQFGDLRRNIGGAADPEVLELKASHESRFVAGEAWHTDGTADAEPSLGSMLYITQMPEIGTGGDTLFASMHLAYELLSPAMKNFLEGLTAVHDGLVPWQGYTPPKGLVLPKSEHPIVVRHPQTGRKLLFVNSGFTTHIVQLSLTESRALLDMLFARVAQTPVLTCRVRWAPNTLVFWDNRCTQHHAVWDYYPFARYGQRVTINGTRPSADFGEQLPIEHIASPGSGQRSGSVGRWLHRLGRARQ